MKREMTVGIVAAAGVFLIAVLGMLALDQGEQAGDRASGTPVAAGAPAAASVAAVPSGRVPVLAEATPPAVVPAMVSVSMPPVAAAATEAAVAPPPVHADAEKAVAAIIARAEAEILAKGYDPETAMRYRVHVARTMARQGLNDARFDEWVKSNGISSTATGAPPSTDRPQRSPNEIAETGIDIVEKSLARTGLTQDMANSLRHEMGVQLIAVGADRQRVEQWFEDEMRKQEAERSSGAAVAPGSTSSDAVAAVGRTMSREIRELGNEGRSLAN